MFRNKLITLKDILVQKLVNEKQKKKRLIYSLSSNGKKILNRHFDLQCKDKEYFIPETLNNGFNLIC